MSLQKSQQNNLRSIFNGNRFIIPEYQRKYSWSKVQREELWTDIKDSIGVMNHFIGTLAFKENSAALSIEDTYDVIDGQQRITSLYILLSVLISKHSDNDFRDPWMKKMIGENGTLKLEPLGNDGEVLEKIIFDYENIELASLKTRSQKKLYEAKRDFIAWTTSIDSDEEVKRYIQFIVNDLEVLVFNVENEAQAVKMFSVINDRGLPLSILDKIKSTLMYYSTIKLDAQLNHDINLIFGEIFDAYDAITLLRKELDILGQFSESTLITQHFYTARKLFARNWSYKIGSDEIFRTLKRVLKQKESENGDLKEFITSYMNELKNYAVSLHSLLAELDTNEVYHKPFIYLEFTATVYPLIIKLYQRDLLHSFIDVLERIELRVYKLKGTNPRWNMYDMASKMDELRPSIEMIRDWLFSFQEQFMSDHTFRNYLNENIYRNASVRYILLEYNNETVSIEEFKDLQKEHIFPVTPLFDIYSYGFESKEEYDYEKDRIGNLILLEKDLNKKNDNDPPSTKATNYLESELVKTRELGGIINMKEIEKEFIDARTHEVIEFCLKRF
jgi:uncharacterized protein with ParB-like and HNH nuclease domain